MLAADQIDDHGMIALAGQIVAQAAADYVSGYAHRTLAGELPAADFLESAGVLERASEIAAYSPLLAQGRRRRATTHNQPQHWAA